MSDLEAANASIEKEKKDAQLLRDELRQARTQHDQQATELQRIKAESNETAVALEQERFKSTDLREQLQKATADKDASDRDHQQTIQKVTADLDALDENHQQTISLLVSEKTSLLSDLEKLEGAEASEQPCLFPMFIRYLCGHRRA